MKLTIIAAIARNRAIGKDGKLLWHIPEDLDRFKKLTTGHTVIMGRKTFESMGNKPLSGRLNIVLTSRCINGVRTYASLEFALQAMKNEPQVFIIGGGRVYADALKYADELHLTMVEKEVIGDTYFPPYEEYVKKHFQLVKEEHNIGFTFRNYVRKK
jgi:dihydrofolate reductase